MTWRGSTICTHQTGPPAYPPLPAQPPAPASHTPPRPTRACRYPVCDGAFEPLHDTGEPLCIKVPRLAGWLRLLYTVAVPFMIVALFIIVLQTVVRYQQRRRLVSLEETGERLRAQRALLIRKMREGAKRQSANLAKQMSQASGVRAASFHDGLARTSSLGSGIGNIWGRGSTPRGQGQQHGGGGGSPSAAEGDRTARERRLEDELRTRDQQLRHLEDIQLRAALHASQLNEASQPPPPPPPMSPPPLTPGSMPHGRPPSHPGFNAVRHGSKQRQGAFM